MFCHTRERGGNYFNKDVEYERRQTLAPVLQNLVFLKHTETVVPGTLEVISTARLESPQVQFF